MQKRVETTSLAMADVEDMVVGGHVGDDTAAAGFGVAVGKNVVVVQECTDVVGIAAVEAEMLLVAADIVV